MKVKNWACNSAEKEFDSITGFVKSGDLDKETAISTLKNANENWGLIGFNCFSEIEEYIDNIIVPSEGVSI
jgi:hypothetical protein